MSQEGRGLSAGEAICVPPPNIVAAGGPRCNRLRDGVGACGGVAAVVGLKKPQAPPTPRFPASQLVETDVCVVTAGQALRQRSDAVSK